MMAARIRGAFQDSVAAGAAGRSAGTLALALALLALGVPVSAQAGQALHFPGPRPAIASAADVSAGRAAPALLRTPAGAFAASLLVPGSGQAALGLRRWVVYGVVEAGLWWAQLDARGDVRAYTRAYRDLAWDVARYPGGAPRRDGGWGYYETMSHYTESGAFDVDPGEAGIQPEQTPGTYNGDVWKLARGLYLPNGTGDPSSPAYAAAIQYYQDRAAGPEFLWTWAGHDAELGEFRQLIEAADDESRTATAILGLILAHHLTSAIDALIVARLRNDAVPGLESDLDASGRDLRLHLGLRIPLSR